MEWSGADLDDGLQVDEPAEVGPLKRTRLGAVRRGQQAGGVQLRRQLGLDLWMLRQQKQRPGACVTGCVDAGKEQRRDLRQHLLVRQQLACARTIQRGTASWQL